MKVGIIDADLLGRKKHRFPNLACEKISAYWKENGAVVELLEDYEHFDDYDEIFISKVFTDTRVPEWIDERVNMETATTSLPEKIHIGGTGFFFAKAPDLPEEIEHHMPDYHLYDDWIEKNVINARNEAMIKGIDFNETNYRNQFKEYTDYSIGFLTRGCFRKCGFCVNQKYSYVFKHSYLNEFYDPTRKKICLLDDNFFGCPKWKELLQELIDTGKKFKFKQGLDERLLTEEKCEMLFRSKYDGDFTFAFDNIEDYDLIHEKLKLIRKYNKKENVKFYVLVGFESIDAIDIEKAFKRIALLLQYGCVPYIMRYQSEKEIPYKKSEFRELYVAIARWCNQQNMIKKKSFREFCILDQQFHKNQNKNYASMRAMLDFEKKYPKIAKKYFDIKFNDQGAKNEK